MTSATIPAIAAGTGALGLVGLWLARRTKTAATDAVRVGGTVPVRFTTYWPYKPGLTAAEKKMEGGTDAAGAWRGQRVVDPATGKRAVVYTLEMYLNGQAPYVTTAGDPAVWPWGQRIYIGAFPQVLFRVTDTGGHFTGTGKLIRVVGHEPLDIAVQDEGSRERLKIPRTAGVQPVPGDNWAGGAKVAYGKLPKSTVVGAEHIDADKEALSRALASCCSQMTDREAHAVGWALRNRAAANYCAVHDILAPEDEYGADVGGYASTRCEPTPRSTRLATEVLSAPAASDPTGGATGYWIPRQQGGLKALGDTYRAAEVFDDLGRVLKYGAYAGFDEDEDEVRQRHEAEGLRVAGRVGAVELLK